MEQGPPLDLIDNKSSELYAIVMRDDIRTLRQLENRLEKNIRKFEKKKKKEAINIRKLSQTHQSGADNSEIMMDSMVNSPIAREGNVMQLPYHNQLGASLSPRSGNSEVQLSVPRPQITRSKSPMMTVLGIMGVDNEGEDYDDADEGSSNQLNRN